MKFRIPAILAVVAALVAWFGGTPRATAESYYEEDYLHLFNPYPKDTGRGSGRSWRVRYFGPVGLGIDFKRPGMTMEIANVEEGSPAAETGKLKKGQIIESINGMVLKDRDPREILGDIITEAEATDGEIRLAIRGEGDVLVKIPVMGRYSETWPLNCPKSDKIVRQLADLIGKEEKPSWGSVLFLLSTGAEKDLDVVRKWMDGIETIGGMNWEKGYKGIGLCEYYLRTGDSEVLPVIKKMTEELKQHMYNGGWSGRGKPAAFTYSVGTGQVHASGMNCMTFLLMARLCGVDVDKYMFDESFQQFYRFAGHGNVAYGNGPPEGGFRDNGKTSGLAVAMAVAAQLSPKGEDSVYAMARDSSAMKSFYATNWFHAAHTGGGMGEIWHHGAMGLVREKRPVQYRSYLDTRRWVMELSRRHDGSVAIAGMDDRYNRSLTDCSAKRAWGTYFALTYTYPRKHLQIWGAPRSRWAKTYPLPDRPWGNLADDVFQSPEPIDGGDVVKLTMEEMLQETVPVHSSLPMAMRVNDPETTEEELLKLVLHPEYGIRSGVVRSFVERGWSHLVLPLLESSDARLRESGLLAITGMFKGRAIPDSDLSPEILDRVGEILEEPKEAWWVSLQAIRAIQRADPDRIATHRDRLLEFLEYDSDWIQKAAIVALAKIATDRDHYEIVLPPIIKTAAALTVDSSSYRSNKAIQDAIRNASRQVKDFAEPFLKKAYVEVPDPLADPYTGAVMRRGARTVRSRIGSIIRQLPDGEEFVRRIPKTTLASYISGRDSDMYSYSGRHTRNPDLIGTWVWAVWPNPNHPDEVDSKIEAWLKPKLGNLPIKLKSFKDTIRFEKDGKVSKSKYYPGYFWSGDMLIGVDDGQALKMDIKTYEGVDFLLIEKGRFGGSPDDDGTAEIPEDFHCGYHVYIRKQ